MSRRSTGFLASRYLERRVPLRGLITNQLASCCIARLLVLATEETHKPIITYIESSGGSVPEALNVISTMNGIRSPVATFCRGTIGGVSAVIAAHGLKGFRTADPAAHFSLALTSELTKNGREATHESYLKLLVQILASDTAQPESEVHRWLTEGAEFNAQQALHHGLVDSVAREPVLPKAG
ncbi:MAG TPA: ATP-dependent Clp protease proteolytic subunit [Verrucomicrobiae bacterium]|nr:ATP-dependent Clp protease proteolytic subunit [Verrucomicrobiae bacterium]